MSCKYKKLPRYVCLTTFMQFMMTEAGLVGNLDLQGLASTSK